MNAAVNPLNKDLGCVLTRVICKCSKLDNVKIFSSIYTPTNPTVSQKKQMSELVLMCKNNKYGAQNALPSSKKALALRR